jgi:class 3 adenylate cyclase/YHS domain-containing protein
VSGERSVIFVDLSRFTTLTDIHGDAAALAVIDRFEELVGRQLQRGTRAVKTLGDGALLEAPDPATAVTVTVGIVEAVHCEPGLPDITGGIHHGHVTERGADILGATVNVASRLADDAPPGTIRTTAAVARAARDVTIEPLGPQRLRGVVEPVDVYELRPCDPDDHGTVTDPVCGMRIVPGPGAIRQIAGGTTRWFCAHHCADRYQPQPGTR